MNLSLQLLCLTHKKSNKRLIYTRNWLSRQAKCHANIDANHPKAAAKMVAF
jgi:hypothetical protein